MVECKYMYIYIYKHSDNKQSAFVFWIPLIGLERPSTFIPDHGGTTDLDCQ